MPKYMVKGTVYDTRTLSGLTTVGFIYETFMGNPDEHKNISSEKSDIYFDSFQTEKKRSAYLDQMAKDAHAENCRIQIKERR